MALADGETVLIIIDVKDGLISTGGLVLFLVVWGFGQRDARRAKARAGQSAHLEESNRSRQTEGDARDSSDWPLTIEMSRIDARQEPGPIAGS